MTPVGIASSQKALLAMTDAVSAGVAHQYHGQLEALLAMTDAVSAGVARSALGNH